MSDIKFFDIKNKTIGLSQKLPPKTLKTFVEKNLEEIFGLRLIASDYLINEGSNDIIETLCLDENNTISIIEYRSGKFGKIINKGLVFVDYIKTNKSVFKMLINDKLGSDIVQAVNYNPRLIIIGDDFNRYDNHAIQKMNISIELIKYQMFDKTHIVFEKNYHSMQIDHQMFTFNFEGKKHLALYKLINDFVLSLGDEVVETGISNVICYRKIKSFAYVEFKENVELTLFFKTKVARSTQMGNMYIKQYTIKTENDFLKIQDEIELSYDQN